MVILLCFLIIATTAPAQVVDLKLDFQTNSVMQIDTSADGTTLWGITSSNVDRLPTIAGVYAVRSTNNGTSWDTSCITPDWWRWGISIAAVNAVHAYAIINRDDTTWLARTLDGKTWLEVNPAMMDISNPLFIHFFNPRVGVVLGTQGRKIERKWVVARTTDGGASWTPSIAMLAEPPTESIGSFNARSAAWDGGTLVIGMNSQRYLITTDTGQTWTFERSPIGRIAGAVISSSGGLQRIQLLANQPSGTVRSVTSTNGGPWQDVTIHPSVKKVDGVRLVASEGIVTIPRSLSNIPCIDIGRGTTVPFPQRVDALAVKGPYLFTSQELMPRQGIVRLQYP